MTVFQVDDDVFGIDVGLFDADVASVYLFDDDEPALVDAGTAASAEAIIDGLAQCGVEPDELRHLILSHVHVDHSGGASALVDEAPELSVYIHELTAPHLMEPSALVESSRRAMGEHFDQMGEQGPVPETNVVEVPDSGTTIDIGDNTLEMVHGPGHSPDHFAVWNPERALLFAAECLGYYFPKAERWVPPSSLPNFDVAVVEETIDELRALDPDRVVLPHFGVWPHDPDAVFETARAELRRFDARVLELFEATDSVEATKGAVADELLELSPPYTPAVEAFYANLVTEGFLKYHDALE